MSLLPPTDSQSEEDDKFKVLTEWANHKTRGGCCGHVRGRQRSRGGSEQLCIGPGVWDEQNKRQIWPEESKVKSFSGYKEKALCGSCWGFPHLCSHDRLCFHAQVYHIWNGGPRELCSCAQVSHIWNGGPREESLPLILTLGAENVRVDKRSQAPASLRRLIVGPQGDHIRTALQGNWDDWSAQYSPWPIGARWLHLD